MSRPGVSSSSPTADGHESLPPRDDSKDELHRLVDLLDEPYVPALVELVRACLPPDTTQGMLWVSLCWACLA